MPCFHSETCLVGWRCAAYYDGSSVQQGSSLADCGAVQRRLHITTASVQQCPSAADCGAEQQFTTEQPFSGGEAHFESICARAYYEASRFSSAFLSLMAVQNLSRFKVLHVFFHWRVENEETALAVSHGMLFTTAHSCYAFRASANSTRRWDTT